MPKQEEQYQCVPPERVAQLMKLGVGYTGYIRFQNGQQIFVEVSPTDNIQIQERYTPQDTVLSVYVTSQSNPLIVEKERQWGVDELRTIQTGNGVAGLTAGAVEHSGIKGTVRFRRQQGEVFSPKYYKDGWAGGSRGKIKTFKVTTIANKIGKGCFVIGIPIEFGLAVTGRQSAMKTGANIIFSAIGAWGGPVGWVVSGLYFGLDLIGAFEPRNIRLQQYDYNAEDPLIIPADATRVEHVRPLDLPIRQKATPIHPHNQAILKQDDKK